ncbi:MAG: hypothetical protein Q8K91_14965 [Hylemonella sp.]|nr:hypothetical protein [Hylemonella sp.]MDP1938502.1 hypothetical protein [Hylemonella sp.]
MTSSSRRFAGYSAEALAMLVQKSATHSAKLQELRAELCLRSSRKAKAALEQCDAYLRAQVASYERNIDEVVVFDGVINQALNIRGQFVVKAFGGTRFTVSWQLQKDGIASIGDRSLDCTLGLVIAEYERFLRHAFVQAPVSQLAFALQDVSEEVVSKLETLSAENGLTPSTWIVPSSIGKARPWWLRDDETLM